VLKSPFTVIGWALNTTVPGGTGVNAVHVYAFPSGGGAGIFSVKQRTASRVLTWRGFRLAVHQQRISR
jgi:hypothetical protein